MKQFRPAGGGGGCLGHGVESLGILGILLHHQLRRAPRREVLRPPLHPDAPGTRPPPRMTLLACFTDRVFIRRTKRTESAWSLTAVEVTNVLV